MNLALSSKHIMVIDDNKMMRRFLSNYFTKKGYNVTEVADGMTALLTLRKGEYPDMIISDIRMPELNGVQFLERVQASPLLSEIPVMILSGQDSSQDRINCLERGAVDFVTKPFNPMELELRVRRYAITSGQPPIA